MKISTIILSFCLLAFNGLAQIISRSSTDQVITVTPKGIEGQMNNHPNVSSTNTALGEQALIAASSITNNTAIGSQTMLLGGLNSPNAFNGNNNTAVGTYALRQNLEGYNNSVLGFLSMDGILGNNSGHSNAVFGHAALSYNQTGSNNAAFGKSALFNSAFGSDNAVFGTYAATANQTGHQHAAFGNAALQFHKTGNGNTAFGVSALNADESGTHNVAFGHLALQDNVSGNANTAMGVSSLYANTTGSFNTALGQNVLQKNKGQSNTVVGFYALDENTTGSNNTALGNYTLHSNGSGSGNIAVGAYAGYFETGSNKLYIDANTIPFEAHITLIGGNMSVTRKACIGCDISATGINDFSTRSETFQVQGAAFKTVGAGNWTFPSDRRLKKKIGLLDGNEMLEKVIQMQGVTYELIGRPGQELQYGFIAQELKAVFPEKVSENQAGYLSASYGDFVPMLVESIKALNKRVDNLAKRHLDLKALNAAVTEIERVLAESRP